MKILHVIYDDIENPWVGGGGASRAREINRLLAKKHSITMLTGNFPEAKSRRIDGINFVRIGFSKRYFLSRLTFTLLIPFYLRKFDSELVVNDFSVFSPVFCHWFIRKPVIHTFYHRIGRQVFKKFWILGVFAFLFEKIFLATAQNIITISPSVTQKIARKNDKRRIECIFTGVDSALFDVDPAPKGSLVTERYKGEYIAYLGRLDIYMKGLDVLIESFHKLSDNAVMLKIAGSGLKKNRDKIEQLINRYQLSSRVQLLGRISDEEKKEFLQQAAFVVMPSRFEGWGIAAIEAAACGKAVIGTNIPGLQDAIIDGKTGLLIEPNNPEVLADAMQTLLQDENLCTSLGQNARSWAESFKWDVIAEKQEAFYKEILRRSN